jgi:ceramide glucosyltransferase
MPFPLALLVSIAHRAWWPVLPLTLFVPGVAAYVISARVLHTRINWVLLPIEDLMSFCFWVAGFSGNNIVWRGRRYRLYPDGRFKFLRREVDG